MRKKSNKKIFGITMSPEVRAALEELARRSDRSMSWIVCHLITVAAHNAKQNTKE